MSAIRWILFDAVGTLIRPVPDVAVAYHRVAARHGCALDVATIGGRFREAFQRTTTKADCAAGDPWETNELAESRRWAALVAEVFGDSVSDIQALFADLWDYFALAQHWQVDPLVNDVWLKLRSLGYRIGIASNFDQRLERLCRDLPPLRLAEHVFHSAGLGTRKPGPAFFRRIGARLGCEPNQLVLVGDDWDLDVMGACGVGWQAIWLQPECGLAHLKSLSAQDPRCLVAHSLAQIPDLVGNLYD